jgi:hypothetical protein
VFIGTKTGSGKSLSYEAAPIIFEESAVTLIVAPLVGIMFVWFYFLYSRLSNFSAFKRLSPLPVTGLQI